MKITFLEAAQADLDEAIEYYNSERDCLGDEFLTEILIFGDYFLVFNN